MKFVCLLLFSIVTVANIRVRAVTYEEPKDCVKKEGKCAVHVDASTEKLNLTSGNVLLGVGSSAIRESADSMTVVRGVVKIDAHSETTIKTLYGELKASGGEVLVEAQDSIVKFTNISSDLKYQPRGEGIHHSLPVGFSTYFAGITTLGVADTGYPKLAEIEPLLHNWSQFYTKHELDTFVQHVKDFMVVWRVAAERVGPWYVDTVDRELAAEKTEEQNLARLRAKREAETRVFRQMLRDRIFGE